MTGFENDSRCRACVVSYLAVSGLDRRTNGIGADEDTVKRGILHYFTRSDVVEETVDPGEPRIIVDLCPGDASGSIVRTRLIGPRSGSAPLVIELLDLLRIQLRCLACGVMVRGAVAIESMHVGSNQQAPIPGSALARACEVEGREIVIPRIAVGEEVYRRLRADESLSKASHELRHEMELIDCMMTASDTGTYYIDYLKASLGDFNYDFDRYSEFLGCHKQFVEAGLAGTSHAGITGTYAWLRNYHNARIDDDISRPERDAFDDECARAMADALTHLRIA